MDPATERALNAVLNEAEWLQIDFEPTVCRAVATFRVMTLPATSDPAEYPLVQIQCDGVRRLAVRLLAGSWSDSESPCLPVALEDLPTLVWGAAVYGGELVGHADAEVQKWGDRVSLDWQGSSAGAASTNIWLFQEADARNLDLCLWWDETSVLSDVGYPVDLTELQEANSRWWAAMRGGDPRTADRGIIPLGP